MRRTKKTESTPKENLKELFAKFPNLEFSENKTIDITDEDLEDSFSLLGSTHGLTVYSLGTTPKLAEYKGRFFDVNEKKK